MTTSTFTISVTGIKIATVNGKNIVKQVDWIIVGTNNEQTFEYLPQTTMLEDPGTDNFIEVDALTQTDVINWIEATDTRLDWIKSHIQVILDKQIESAALTTIPLPWTLDPETPNI